MTSQTIVATILLFLIVACLFFTGLGWRVQSSFNRLENQPSAARPKLLQTVDQSARVESHGVDVHGDDQYVLEGSWPQRAASPLAAHILPHVAKRAAAPQAMAPSGVDGLPFAVQQAAFASTFLALIASALGIDAAYKAVQRARPTWWWDAWETGAALLLGAIFVTAGRSHFTVPEAFKAIYPPPGTWGFWYLPGSADFHVAWTGIAEICGGSGLLLSGLVNAMAIANWNPGGLVNTLAPTGKSQLLPFSARAVFLLVLSVTPANFFMFSHGATMPGIAEGELSMSWHFARFVAQVSILSVLLTLSDLQIWDSSTSAETTSQLEETSQ